MRDAAHVNRSGSPPAGLRGDVRLRLVPFMASHWPHEGRGEKSERPTTRRQERFFPLQSAEWGFTAAGCGSAWRGAAARQAEHTNSLRSAAKWKKHEVRIECIYRDAPLRHCDVFPRRGAETHKTQHTTSHFQHTKTAPATLDNSPFNCLCPNAQLPQRRPAAACCGSAYSGTSPRRRHRHTQRRARRPPSAHSRRGELWPSQRWRLPS